MIKFLKIISGVFLTVFLALTITSSVSYAQASDPAVTHGITFPIVALGNCNNLNSCKTFCDDPINKDICIAFAKSKGFYQQDALASQEETILQKAKTNLGCDSETSCLNFCTIPSNQDKCNSFAKANNLQGGEIETPDSQTIISKAQTVLGCNSQSSCQSFCEQAANRAKCTDFAQQVGLRGGDERVGPGGCNSQETCQTFCSNPNNFQICASFSQSAGNNFSGPGGCNSPQSCETYCKQNPQSCPGFSNTQNSQNGFNPVEMCDRTPNCSWTGQTCFCGNTNNNPEGSPDPASMCARYGCTWTGNTCQCTNINNSYNTQVYSDINMSYSQQEANCKLGGGSCAAGSTGTFCNCQGYKPPYYSPNPYSSSYPQPTGSSCQPPSAGCGANSYYDYNRCGCYQNGSNPYSTSSTCQPPSGGCGLNSYYDYNRCGCYQNGSTPYPTSGSSSCQPPTSGCGSNSYYDYNRCGCYQYSNSTTPAPTSSGSCTLQPPSSGCGTGSAWDQSRCGCYPTSTSTSQPTNTSQPNNSFTPQSSPTVQGASTGADFWTSILNFLKRIWK